MNNLNKIRVMHPIKHSKQIIIYIFTIICISFSGYSQNSVGINTQTPNKNAVLELVSPLNNQGFLLPKVTTAQRTALSFTDSLKAEDQGLLVYDSDENIFYYWNNGAWEKVSKGDIPALDTILSIGNSANSYRIKNLGTPIDTYDAATKKYVDDSITTIKNDITQINTDITKLYDSVTNINNDITNLYDSVTNINTDITNLYDSVTNINTDITNLYDSVTNINTDITNLYDSVTNINTDITNLYDSVTNINTDITNLYDSVTNINTDITNLYDSVTNINTDITNLYDSVTNINTDITNLYDSVTNINTDITNLYDSVTNINTDITNLYDSVTNITNQVTNLISYPNVSLNDGYILVGDATDTARAVSMSGAISIDNAGVTSLSNGVIDAPKLAADGSGT
ncbi:MAG: hypothetical protein GX277_05585, partial [Bacteroidales bacterium]|nr:hypothetical protein [Bacteroidales bacterium]